MNPGSKLLTAVFLSLAMWVPSMASAVTLSAYENAQSDPAKQSKILHEASSTALAKTVTQLRSSTFADGKEKTQQRLDKDRKLAILVNEVAVYATDDQSWALIIAVDKYAADGNMGTDGTFTHFAAEKLGSVPSVPAFRE